MRRLIAVLLTLGLAVAGVQAAHALTYHLAEPHGHAREQLLAETGHDYLQLAPAALALVIAIVVLAGVWEAAVVRAGRRGVPLRAWMFLAVAPLTFAMQELLERLLHDRAFPWGAVAEPTFALGLLLQAPFALLAYALGRLLLGVARAVARLLGQPRLRTVAAPDAQLTFITLLRRSLACERPLGPRGPPLLAR